MTERHRRTPADPRTTGTNRYAVFSADKRRQRLRGVAALAAFVLTVLLATTAAFGLPSDAMRLLPGVEVPAGQDGGAREVGAPDAPPRTGGRGRDHRRTRRCT